MRQVKPGESLYGRGAGDGRAVAPRCKLPTSFAGHLEAGPRPAKHGDRGRRGQRGVTDAGAPTGPAPHSAVSSFCSFKIILFVYLTSRYV